MIRRISLWMLVGIVIACCWAVIALLAGPNYNLGRSLAVAITAPASLLGRTEPLGVASFILLNAVPYAIVGCAIELIRQSRRSLKNRI